MNTTFVKLAVGSCLVGVALTASAATQTYSVGSLLSGGYSPSATFATLTETTSDNKTFTFTLSAKDLDQLFVAGAFIGSLAIDMDTASAGKLNLPSITATTGDGVASVDANKGGGPGGDFDFRYKIGGGNDKLLADETVTWTSTFSSAVTFSSLALHVQGLTEAQGGSAWYSVTAVPEPETYAMLLAGLGLMGAVARRRRQA